MPPDGRPPPGCSAGPGRRSPAAPRCPGHRLGRHGCRPPCRPDRASSRRAQTRGRAGSAPLFLPFWRGSERRTRSSGPAGARRPCLRQARSRGGRRCRKPLASLEIRPLVAFEPVGREIEHHDSLFEQPFRPVRHHDMLGAPIELAPLLRNEDRLNVARHNFLPAAWTRLILCSIYSLTDCQCRASGITSGPWRRAQRRLGASALSRETARS